MKKQTKEMLQKNEEMFKERTERMLNIYKAKNNDYGNSFGETFQKLGVVSAASRIYDKANRLCNLCSGVERLVEDEDIRQTLYDMANYCVMTIMEMDVEEEERMRISREQYEP